MLKTNYIGFHRWFQFALDADQIGQARRIFDLAVLTLELAPIDLCNFIRMTRKSLKDKDPRLAVVLEQIPFANVQ